MNSRTLAAALVLAAFWHGDVLAQTEAADRGPSWFDRIEIGGTVEIEATQVEDYAGESTSDIDLATAELVVSARIHDMAHGEITLAKNDDDAVEVDAATVTIGLEEDAFALVAGKQTLPFGMFDSNFIASPLTSDLGEAKEIALTARFSSGGLAGSAFAFNGDSDIGGDDVVAGYGAALGYSMEHGDFGLGMGVSYIGDLGDSDTLQDAIADALGEGNSVAARVSGWAASLELSHGGFSFLGEYVAATEAFAVDAVAFDGQGAEPAAWMVEASYALDMMVGRPATISAGYQGTTEALALDLPKSRILFGVALELLEGVGLGIEWTRDRDYGTDSGGTGEAASTITLQLAAEF